MNALELLPTHDLFSKEEINNLPMLSYQGEIIVVRSQEELELVLPRIKQESVLGFDTETRPLFKKGIPYKPSLIQLATKDTVYLIQINLVPFNKHLADILSDAEIVKAGVAVKDDLNALAKIFPFKPQSFVELADLANQKGLKAQGLRTIAANLLGFRISKKAQCSNWASPYLTHAQIKYAATDAWLGRILYHSLMQLEDSPDHVKNQPKPKKKKEFRRRKKTVSAPTETLD